MPESESSAFVSAWGTLTANQKKSLLAQLRQFISQNSERNTGHARLTNSNSKSDSTKLPSPKKPREKDPRTREFFKPRDSQASFGEPVLGSGGAIHHSPPKVGNDGFPKYERTLVSLEALKTCYPDWVPLATVQSKIVGKNQIAVKRRKKRRKRLPN